jgi:hypothetical protein
MSLFNHGYVIHAPVLENGHEVDAGFFPSAQIIRLK